MTDRPDAHTTWHSSRASTLDHVWQLLGRAIADRRSPLRVPVMATVSAEGTPEARVVVLRRSVRSAGTLTVHTDNRTNKVRELEANSSTVFCAWMPKDDLQIRIKAIVEILSGTDALPSWDALPDSARRVYGGSPAPGVLLAHPSEHAMCPDPAAFTILECHIQEIETLHLGRDLHRRARFRRQDDWKGTWLVP